MMFSHGLAKGLSIGLIIVGAVGFPFALATSAVVTIGISVISFIIGLAIYFKSSSMNKTNPLRITLLFIVMAFFFSACTIKVPMVPNVGEIGVTEAIPLEAGLLITEQTKNYTITRHPESFTASARPHEFPLGEALEKASVQTFSQVFKKVTLVRTTAEAQNYKIIIEPQVGDFHFRYDALSQAGFAVAVFSRITVQVTLYNGAIKIWERSIESPEQKRGPWVVNLSYEKDVGESASDALGIALKAIALQMYKDIDLGKLASGQ